MVYVPPELAWLRTLFSRLYGGMGLSPEGAVSCGELADTVLLLPCFRNKGYVQAALGSWLLFGLPRSGANLPGLGPVSYALPPARWPLSVP